MKSASTAVRQPGGAKARSALNTVISRNNFYRDGYQTLLRIAVIEGIAIAALVIALIVTIAVTDPQDRFFATTDDGRILELVPLNQPNLSDDAVITWASEAAVRVMTFGFHDYRRRLQDASSAFTRGGWASFTDALDKSGVLEAVEANRQVLTAVPQQAPVIIEKGDNGGVYRWVVQFPMIVTYQSGNVTQTERSMVTLVIERISTLETPKGIGIDQWIQEPQ